jgi:DNA-binding YbaB/EbfC family protein
VKGNIGDLMKQAQEMQEKMQQAQQELANTEVEGQAGAGMVKVTMTGRYDVKRVTIDDMVIGEDKEVLEDLLAAAVNDAVKKVEANNQNAMGSLLPAGFKMPF